jgi:predicted nucleic acid-binding protein
MSVLIDTSVWIDHLRNANAALVDLIGLDLALIPPMVVSKLYAQRPLRRVARPWAIWSFCSPPTRPACLR